MTGVGPALDRGNDATGFAGVVDLVRHVLPEGLIDDHGWERLAARAARLPWSAADAMFGFEFRLDDPEASADLLLSAQRDTPFAEALVRDGTSGGPKAAALARFLSELQRPASSLGSAVGQVALEYDIAGTTDYPAPGVFLCSAAESGYADPGLLAGAVALASGWNEDLLERRGIERILAALPRCAAVRWAGAFPDRKKRSVRMLVRALGDAGPAFLERIGWPGDPGAVKGIVSAFRSRGVKNHVLALDVSADGISPGLGLELSRWGRGSGWRDALDMMTWRGWCLPAKAAALSRVTRSERIYSPVGAWDLHCGLHHVKLAAPADSPAFKDDATRAKGYVSCVLRVVP